jgi:hypothetical protein
MSTIPTLDQWKRGLQIAEQIEALEAELKAILGGEAGNVRKAASGKKRGVSAAGRARIAAAQRLRWSKIKKAGSSAPSAKATAKKKRTMSPEAKAKLAKAMKARWAAAKAGKGPVPTARKK